MCKRSMCERPIHSYNQLYLLKIASLYTWVFHLTKISKTIKMCRVTLQASTIIILILISKAFNNHGNDNLRSSRTQNKLERRLPLAKVDRICYTSMGSLSPNKLELNIISCCKSGRTIFKFANFSHISITF